MTTKSRANGSSRPMQSPVSGYLLQLRRQETSKPSCILCEQTSSTLVHSERQGGLRRAGVAPSAGSHFGNTDRHTSKFAYWEHSVVPLKNRR